MIKELAIKTISCNFGVIQQILALTDEITHKRHVQKGNGLKHETSKKICRKIIFTILKNVFQQYAERKLVRLHCDKNIVHHQKTLVSRTCMLLNVSNRNLKLRCSK